MAAITLHNVTLGYQRHPAVHHLSGSFASGSMTAIVGPNGSGKSTLLKGITGFLRPMEGSIDRGGLQAHQIAYLPQRLEVDRSFPITVLDTVLLGLWQEIGMFGGVNRTLWQRAAKALSTVGLGGLESRGINELSGGQFQRVMFARMSLQNAPVLIFDEPFNAIDQQTVLDLMAVIRRWHEEGRTLLIVVHDLVLVREFFPQALLLAREPVTWGKTSEVLTEEHLLQSRTMAQAWDRAAAICRQEPL
ncbi:MAG: metal ABC transporter ATP-binding protein [Desulfobulbus sp.]|nr:metal ABC transporter ATP-binding protein [Desulfobulbus sp.]